MKRSSHGLGALLILVLCIVIPTFAEDANQDHELRWELEPEDLERVLRGDRGFSRILRSSPEDAENEEEVVRRSLEPASFSRILRSSFSRILKRDPVSFSRILKRSGSPSFSRILRQDNNINFSRILRNPYERNMRAQQFSRILKRSADGADLDRFARSAGFSRIL